MDVQIIKVKTPIPLTREEKKMQAKWVKENPSKAYSQMVVSRGVISTSKIKKG